ncbi:MAG: hypothetical protein EBX41_04280 [Chitinophagia bacterium]|nr:hypothetical protein [Chitinophagia bacterium]
MHALNALIAQLKAGNCHTPLLAYSRFLLALCFLLTLYFNDLATLSVADMPGYASHHSAPLKYLNLFYLLPAGIAKAIAIAILLATMSGFLPRITALLHFWVAFSLYNYITIMNGGDKIAYLFALLLLPVCLTDPRLNQWKPHNPAPHNSLNIIPNLAIVFVKLQAAWVYIDAGTAKLANSQWRDGTALYYYTSHYRLGAPQWLRSLNEYITLTSAGRVLNWGVLAFELLLGIALFLPKRFRKMLFIPAVVFHLLIAVNFGLVSFFIAIAGMLILYLLV